MNRRAASLLAAALLTACAACGDAAPGVSTDDGAPSSTGHGETASTSATLDDSAGEEPDSPTTAGAETTEVSETTLGPPPDDVEDEPPAVCGDGRVAPGEQCDHGEDLNDDHKFCTDACKLNICGDGLLFDGPEDCDQGAANSDEYGSICTELCTRGTWCGDNIIQPEHEECDNGPGNGVVAVDEQGISCDPMCRMNARRIFITSHAYTGDLGGLSGADEKCRKAALDAGLPEPERFMALLSDAGMSMKTRYEDKLGEALPYVLLTGMKLADSYTSLLQNGPGDLGIYVDEHMQGVQHKFVASNTAADGSIYQEFDEQNKLKVTDCDGWTSSDKAVFGRLGLNAKSADDLDYALWKQEKGWLSSATKNCSWAVRLYCIEL